MRVITLNTITEFCEYLGLVNLGEIIESDLETEENECDKHKRKLRDAEVLCTVAANADGDCLDLGTSHGRSAYRIATNLHNGFKVYTVNLLPEQFDASSGSKVTHLLSEGEIGSYFKNRNIENIQQIYADTAKWDIPDEINNISVCYVDAAHDTELVYNDSRKIYPRIKNGGFICWHDFNPELRNKFEWIDSAMRGVEWFVNEYSSDGEIVHLKDSWVGVYRKQKVCPRYRVGLVLDREFHESNRWVSATTPYFVNSILQQFECSIISSQAEYEATLPGVDVILSMEPGWAAPILDFNRTKAIKGEFNKKSSFILYSDPHKDKWREDYFLTNNIDYILAFYDSPTKYHFRKTPHNRILHFPWCVPDHWITHNQIECKGQKSIAIFGAQHHDAYTVRNWCRNFPFVENNSYSGVENKVLSSEEYILKLQAYDAGIAAGSESLEYRLTMPKYFEIPATGALLFAQRTDDLEKLGFRHKENCLFFTQDNFEQIAKEYLLNPHNYLTIRNDGRELIRKRHSLSTRMNGLSEYIEKTLEAKKIGTHDDIVTHFDALGSLLFNSSKEQTEIHKKNDTQSWADGDVVSNTHDMFTKYFEMICVPELLPTARTLPFFWQNKPLEWEVCHELLAFHAFCGEETSVSNLIELSNNRYKLLDDLWPGNNPSTEQLDHFYTESAKVLPWGHGVFLANHETLERRKLWLRRLAILEFLQDYGAESVMDYGAGGGHTSLLAYALGFHLVIHHDYEVFHPFVQWRVEKMPQQRGRFIFSDANIELELSEKLDAICCMDVVEHVFNPGELLSQIYSYLKPDGLLVWVAAFNENISSHLHRDLADHEEDLLLQAGFVRYAELPAEYSGHTGFFRKVAMVATTAQTENRILLRTKHPIQLIKPEMLNQLSNNNVIVSLAGVSYELIPERYLDDELIRGHLFEEETVVLMAQLLRPDMTVMDVGANFGYYTLLFSRWVGESGNVIAVEPTLEYGARLARNLARNAVTNVLTVALAFSDVVCEANINIGKCSATMHWPFDDETPRKIEKVKLTTLDNWWDDYLEKGNADRLDSIKIDLDGHEPRFILGGLNTLKRLSPIICLKFFKPQYEDCGFTCNEVVAWLREQLDYVLYDVRTGAPFLNDNELFSYINSPTFSANVLCIPGAVSEKSDPECLPGKANLSIPKDEKITPRPIAHSESQLVVGIHPNHKDPEKYHDKWAHFLTNRGVRVKWVNLLSDNYLNEVSGCNGLMWRWLHNWQDKQSARPILCTIQEYLKVPTFPDVKTCWHYDEKVSQYYLLSAVKAPMPRTWVFWDKETAIEWAESADYPVVFKLSVGAGSSNVLLIRTKSEALNLIMASFTTGIYPYTMNEFRSEITQPQPPHLKPEFDYIYFQEYLSGNAFDTRITIIGNRAFGYRRFNRPDDFRASGSGLIDHDMSKIDKKCVSIAFKISEQCNFSSMAYDFIYKDGMPLVCEISYTFVDYLVYNCPGYWDRDLNRTEGHMWPEQAQVDDFVEFLSGRKVS